MSKGGGNSGGRKNSGGAGGRSATRGKESVTAGLKSVLKRMGIAFAIGTAVEYATNPGYRATVNLIARQVAAMGNAWIGQNVVPITKGMRDKVRAWATERVAAAAARGRGEVNVEGVAIDAVRAALTGQTARSRTALSTRVNHWRDIPDQSVIGFSSEGPRFSGKSIKSLIRDGIRAGRNAESGKTYERKASQINAAMKGRGPKRKKT